MIKNFLIALILFLPLLSFSQLTASFSYTSPLCKNDTVFFTNTSTGIYSLSHWEFGDGTDTWTNNPKHIFLSTGNFSVKLTIIDSLGNSDNTSSSLTINPVPTISLIKNSLLQTLTAHSTETNLSFKWLFNTDTTTETDSVIYYLESGKYTVVATNSFSCSFKTSTDINLNTGGPTNPEDTLEIIVKNNILTPDIRDGANDVLFIDGLASFINPCSVVVYNKWGQMVYKNDNYTNLGGFEGKNNNGKSLDAGTYYYIIRSQGRKTATGYVDLIR